MFRCKTAWFSSSVKQNCINFWTLEGGFTACWRTADYLFSEDVTCPDTLKIFQSKAFLWDKVTVFHSLFLSTCEKRQSVKSVCIGHYILPPALVLHEVRDKIGRLIWECEDVQLLTQDSQDNLIFLVEKEFSGEESNVTEPELSETDSSENQQTGSSFTDIVSMENLQQFTGCLCAFHPGYFLCSCCKVP